MCAADGIVVRRLAEQTGVRGGGETGDRVHGRHRLVWQIRCAQAGRLLWTIGSMEGTGRTVGVAGPKESLAVQALPRWLAQERPCEHRTRGRRAW